MNAASRAWSARPKTPLVLLGVGLLIAAIALPVVVVRRHGNDSFAKTPPTEVLIPVLPGVYGFDRPPPPSLVRYAKKIYRANWESCQRPWSDLLADAGELPSRPFSQAALEDIAPKLPYYPRSITFDGLLNRVANTGCVEGFLYLLERDRSYAVS